MDVFISLCYIATAPQSIKFWFINIQQEVMSFYGPACMNMINRHYGRTHALYSDHYFDFFIFDICHSFCHECHNLLDIQEMDIIFL